MINQRSCSIAERKVDNKAQKGNLFQKCYFVPELQIYLVPELQTDNTKMNILD